MSQPSLAFGLLGPLQLSIDGIPVRVGTPKQRAVLAALLMNRNRVVAADSLINAVWVEDAPPEARASIHTYVSNLRRLLGAAGVEGRHKIEKVSPGYRLHVADADVDLGRFIHEKNEGVQAAAAGQFEEASSHFSTALAEWRGDVLADLSSFEFISVFATAMVEDKIATHIARVEAEIACGRAKAVIGELERLVADHPYREPAWEQLMIAYYISTRQSDALDAYHRLKVVLADDLGIDPSPTLRDLYQRILRQERLDVQQSARASVTETLVSVAKRSATSAGSASVRLRTRSGECYPLKGVNTRIGRLADNDICLADAKVSRHHAVIIDTGTSFVLIDVGSANGVFLEHSRIRGSASLVDGTCFRIGDREFTFELDAGPAE